MADKNLQDEILPLQKLKATLAFAEQEPIGCAVGLTKDKQVLLFASKKTKPKGCSAELKKFKDQFDPASLRFGQISVDKQEPGVLRFSLNRKEAGGTPTAMNKLIKKAGYQACVFLEDPNLEDDTAEDGENTSAEDISAVSSGDDTDKLKARLTAQVQRMSVIVAGHPQLKTTLITLAKEAQTKLDGDPAAAAAACYALEKALDAAAGTNGTSVREGMAEEPKATDGPRVAMVKSTQLWRACRTSLTDKLDKVKESILAAYADEPEVQSAIRQNLGELDSALGGFDDRLDDALDDAMNASEPGERAKHLHEVKLIIADYIKQVSTNQRLAALDSNPFGVQPGLREALTKTLSALVGLAKTAA